LPTRRPHLHEERVGHRPADDQLVDLRQQVLDHGQLVADLGAAEDRDEGTVRLGQHLAERGELLLHQQPRRRGQVLADHADGGVGAMRRAERVVHVDVAVLRQRSRERLVARFLGVVEPQVLEHEARPGRQRLRRGFGRGTDAVLRILDRRTEQLAEPLRGWLQPHRLDDLALRPPEMRHQHGAPSGLQDGLDRRKALADAGVARDLPLGIEGYVEVDAHEHALAGQLEIGELFGHGSAARDLAATTGPVPRFDAGTWGHFVR
jgi:hypothetical protein